jgi:D-xylose transport system ATP-binding protein
MSEHILEMRNITKDFPGVRALDNVSYYLRPGTVHGLVGENGAGKSTMVKILCGVYPHGTYAGSVLINGREQGFQSIRDSERAGVAIIYQELATVKELSICENFFIGQEIARHGIIDWNAQNRTVKEALRAVSMEGVDPNRKIKELGVGHQQLVEIAKALHKQARILVLDEPTSSLSEAEVSRLFDILRGLRGQGVSCIYISHRLDEVFQIADEVTVLRDGQIIGNRAMGELTRSELIKMMVGRELTQMYPRKPHTPGQVVLEVRDWTAYQPDLPEKPVVKNVSFQVRQGEILGLAGLMGSGRTELAMNLIGAWGIKGEGTLLLDGKEVNIGSPRNAIQAGISCLSENRKEQGLVLIMDVRENITAASSGHISRMGIIDHALEAKEARSYVEALRIKCFSIQQEVGNLSGGNQQKVCFAKWMMTRPRVLILDEPTRGVDVGAKVEIYDLINKLVDEGVCVVLISSEHQEILGMCDRILVMGGGEIRAELDWKEATQEKILAYSIGEADERR